MLGKRVRQGKGMPGYSSAWRRLTERLRAHEVDPWCWWCNQPIDLRLDSRDAMSLTYDHIVPKVNGGTDTEDNAARAHRRCNSQRMQQWKKVNNNINSIPIKQSRSW